MWINITGNVSWPSNFTHGQNYFLFFLFFNKSTLLRRPRDSVIPDPSRCPPPRPPRSTPPPTTRTWRMTTMRRMRPTTKRRRLRGTARTSRRPWWWRRCPPARRSNQANTATKGPLGWRWFLPAIRNNLANMATNNPIWPLFTPKRWWTQSPPGKKKQSGQYGNQTSEYLYPVWTQFSPNTVDAGGSPPWQE